MALSSTAKNPAISSEVLLPSPVSSPTHGAIKQEFPSPVAYGSPRQATDNTVADPHSTTLEKSTSEQMNTGKLCNLW